MSSLTNRPMSLVFFTGQQVVKISSSKASGRLSMTSWSTSMRNLNDEELEGVLAHELAHVKHRDILISSVAATLAAAIVMISRFAMFWGATGRSDDREGGTNNPLVLLATIILAPIAAMLIQMAVSRSREYAADAGGAALAGSPMERAPEARVGVARGAARRQPGHRAHVHHQAVVGFGFDGDVQHASAN